MFRSFTADDHDKYQIQLFAGGTQPLIATCKAEGYDVTAIIGPREGMPTVLEVTVILSDKGRDDREYSLRIPLRWFTFLQVNRKITAILSCDDFSHDPSGWLQMNGFQVYRAYP